MVYFDIISLCLSHYWAEHIKDPSEAMRLGDVMKGRMSLVSNIFLGSKKGFIAGFPVSQKLQ